MRRTLTVAITASALIAGCAAAMALDRRARMPAPPPVYSPFVSASGASETLRDPEAYAVFDMVLSDVVGPIRSADVLTIDLQRQLRLPAGMPADWSSVVRDAREKNSRWWALDRSWSPGSSWRVWTGDAEAVDAIERQADRWQARGLTLSVPGFNEARTRALIYFSYHNFIDCCSAWFALEKVNGRWVESTHWRLGFGAY